MSLKYLKSDYVPKGEVTGFPLEVVDKMLEKQVEQYNKANVEVFENSIIADLSSGGFAWSNTKEGHNFWRKIIVHENFDLFFEKFPKEELIEEKSPQKELPLPRVIEVIDVGHSRWLQRVCFMFKNDKALCWTSARTLEDAENETYVTTWSQWREVGEGPKSEYHPFDFSDGAYNHSFLVGKKLFSKSDDSVSIIHKIHFDEYEKVSYINGFSTKFALENYTFEEGLPVGIEIVDN